jgi:hypothetical protein
MDKISEARYKKITVHLLLVTQNELKYSKYKIQKVHKWQTNTN